MRAEGAKRSRSNSQMSPATKAHRAEARAAAAADPNAAFHIFAPERVLILRLLSSLRLKESPKTSVKAKLEAFVHIMGDRYSKITNKTIDQWEAAAQLVQQDVLKARDPERVAEDELILTHLLRVSDAGTLFSLAQAVRLAKTKVSEKVTRSRVYLLLGAHFVYSNRANGKAVDVKDYSHHLLVLRDELMYIVGDRVIIAPLIFNIDETCVRIVPEDGKKWLAKGSLPAQFTNSNIDCFKMTAHTTVLCGVACDGQPLLPQINYKGKSESLLTNTPGLIEYLSPETHWTTVGSLMNYVEKAIMPRVRHTRHTVPTAKFVILLDCATVHTGWEFRKQFFDTYGTIGTLVFIPPRTTATTLLGPRFSPIAPTSPKTRSAVPSKTLSHSTIFLRTH
eukprot:GILJ01017721.1.p1 GENE.GILJ01017721.1~~GILJ01017721.1.p1  ORF type:complete len:446 (+),score=45.30 GILJ01017721.1:160-1338(+)